MLRFNKNFVACANFERTFVNGSNGSLLILCKLYRASLDFTRDRAENKVQQKRQKTKRTRKLPRNVLRSRFKITERYTGVSEITRFSGNFIIARNRYSPGRFFPCAAWFEAKYKDATCLCTSHCSEFSLCIYLW